MGIILRGPGVYVPSHILTNADLVELVDKWTGEKVLHTSEEWIEKRSGILERRVAIDEDVKEIGRKAILDLQSKLGEELTADEIRFATNRHRDGEFPCYAASTAGVLGIDDAALSDTLAGCTGLVYGIRDAFNAIKAGEHGSALVGGIERLTDFTDYSDRSTCFLFGDGAGWYKLEVDPGKEGIIANVVGGTPDLGNEEWPHGHLTIVTKEGKKLKYTEDGFSVILKAKNEFEEDREIIHPPNSLYAADHIDDYLIMQGQEVFKFATKVMRHAVHEVLHRSDYALEDVDVIIPHGANMRIINAAKSGLERKGFKGTVYTNMDMYGNTSTASIPLAAADAIEKGIIQDGSLVINVAFGAGFTYGANLYRATLE